MDLLKTIAEKFDGDMNKAKVFLENQLEDYERLRQEDAALTNKPYQPDFDLDVYRTKAEIENETRNQGVNRRVDEAIRMGPVLDAASARRGRETQDAQRLPTDVQMRAIESRERMFGRQNTTNMINNILRGAALFAL
jgi:hypothetical protein|tara:strand:- start:78 stop:488 length:411 start_codon:yes stop_codon:yes gene_type:complete